MSSNEQECNKDRTLWLAVKGVLDKVLEPICIRKAAEFEVICDVSNNSLESIALGYLNITVRFPSGSLNWKGVI